MNPLELLTLEQIIYLLLFEGCICLLIMFLLKLSNRSKNVLDDIPTVKAIPKADYENRLKADMVAMLTDLQLEIEESCICTYEVTKLIQQKIDNLKEVEK